MQLVLCRTKLSESQAVLLRELFPEISEDLGVEDAVKLARETADPPKRRPRPRA